MYDVIILGAGMAGLSASIYAARAGLKTLIIEKGAVGGQITLTLSVDNYPGDDTNPTGMELSEKMMRQADKFGVERITDEIIDTDLTSKVKVLKSRDKTYEAKAVILATGANPRKLNIPGEDEFTGKGVAFCATCDGPFYTGSEIYVIGGGDAALEEAVFLTTFARKVYVVYRGDRLRAAKAVQEQAMANDKIEFIFNSEIKEITGDQFGVNKVKMVNNVTNEVTYLLPKDGDKDFGVFIFVGYVPNTSLFEGVINLDKGYIVTDDDMRTNIEGVYAAGDVRKKTVRQVVTAASDGAIAAVNVGKYLGTQK